MKARKQIQTCAMETINLTRYHLVYHDKQRYFHPQLQIETSRQVFENVISRVSGLKWQVCYFTITDRKSIQFFIYSHAYITINSYKA